MPHTLQLRVPDHVYEALLHRAEETGGSPETLATEWLASAAHTTSSEDPLEAFIGAFKSSVPDGADEHDRYLNATLADEMTGEEDSGA